MFRIVGSIHEISRSEDAAEFEWRIPESETEELRRGRVLWSPYLSFGGTEWELQLRLEDPNSPLALRLFPGPYSDSFPAFRYCLGAMKADGEEEEIGRGTLEPGVSFSSMHPWLRLSELRRRMGRSAPSSGVLTFILRFRSGPETEDEMRSLMEREEPVLSLEATAEKSTQTDFEDAQTNSPDAEEGGASNSATREEPPRSDSADTLILKENFKNLLLHGSNHDVLLRVKDKEFKAHKNVLGARSPVFEAMFQHPMKENEQDEVTIEDVDPDCFGAFLTYLYTGGVEDLSAADAVSLYYAADKYHIPSLKRRCVDVLKASLSTSLVCDVIALAATHGEEELLESTMAFFTEHQDEVMETVEWQRFLLANPVRASEVCLTAVKRYRASHSESCGPCK